MKKAIIAIIVVFTILALGWLALGEWMKGGLSLLVALSWCVIWAKETRIAQLTGKAGK